MINNITLAEKNIISWHQHEKRTLKEFNKGEIFELFNPYFLGINKNGDYPAFIESSCPLYSHISIFTTNGKPKKAFKTIDCAQDIGNGMNLLRYQKAYVDIRKGDHIIEIEFISDPLINKMSKLEEYNICVTRVEDIYMYNSQTPSYIVTLKMLYNYRVHTENVDELFNIPFYIKTKFITPIRSVVRRFLTTIGGPDPGVNENKNREYYMSYVFRKHNKYYTFINNKRYELRLLKRKTYTPEINKSGFYRLFIVKDKEGNETGFVDGEICSIVNEEKYFQNPLFKTYMRINFDNLLKNGKYGFIRFNDSNRRYYITVTIKDKIYVICRYLYNVIKLIDITEIIDNQSVWDNIICEIGRVNLEYDSNNNFIGVSIDE